MFKEHFKGMCFFAMEYVKDYDTAREIVQEAFVNLWEKRKNIDTEKSPKSYLSTTVRNRCFNYLRDHKKFDRELIEFEGLDSNTDHFDEDHLVTEELKKTIEMATAALPEKCREVFLLNRMEQMKYHEIADRLDISIKTVEARMSKALKLMREKLADYITILFIIIEIIIKQ